MKSKDIEKGFHTRDRKRNKVKDPKKALWTEEEDEQFLNLMEGQTKINIDAALTLFPNKTKQQINEHWQKCICPNFLRGNWTPEEDQKILELVQRYGTKNWAKIASFLKPRVGKQIRERWYNVLNPTISRQKWEPEEDSILIRLHFLYGNQWNKISESLPGRPPNSVKNRWNSTLKKNVYEPPKLPLPIIDQSQDNKKPNTTTAPTTATTTATTTANVTAAHTKCLHQNQFQNQKDEFQFQNNLYENVFEHNDVNSEVNNDVNNNLNHNFFEPKQSFFPQIQAFSLPNFQFFGPSFYHPIQIIKNSQSKDNISEHNQDQNEDKQFY